MFPRACSDGREGGALQFSLSPRGDDDDVASTSPLPPGTSSNGQQE